MPHPHGQNPTRSALDVIQAQVAAVDAWMQASQQTEAFLEAAGTTRELRLDVSRRLNAHRREHAAIVAHVDAQLRATGDPLPARPARTVVLAHRNSWMVDRLHDLLAARGIVVVASVDDGADAAGTIVAEQPDLVLLEDRLPTVPGIEVVRRAREFSPHALVGVQTLDSEGLGPLVEAGAHAVFTRRIPPADIVDQVLGCLSGEVEPTRALTLV